MSERYWSDAVRLYSDGCFEVLWGRWQNDKNKCLGIHWLKTEESYPCPMLYGGELGWLVVPEFLTLSILKDILVRSTADHACGMVDAIVDAMREYVEQSSK